VPPRRGGVAVEERRAGWGGESWRADVGAAGLAGVGRQRCAHVGKERRVGEERRGASEKRGASGTGAARRGGGEDGRVKEERRDLGETVKCLGGLYRTPTFCHGSY
jgi:hypothetical protein